MTRLGQRLGRLALALVAITFVPALAHGQHKPKAPAPADPGAGTASVPPCYSDNSCYNNPPSITFTLGYDPVNVGSRNITVRYCDDWNLGTPTLKLNGTTLSLPVTNVSGCTATKQQSGTISLPYGMDTLTATICDISQFYLNPPGPYCTTRSATLEYRTVAVNPLASTVRRVPTSSGQTVSFRVKNLDAITRGYTISCATSGAGLGTSCTPSLGSVALAPNDSIAVDAIVSTNAAGTSGTVTLKATDPNATANTHSATTTVYSGWAAGSASPIVVYQTPTNNDRFAPEMCVADCFDLTTTHATPAYVSLGTPRSAVLTYRGQRARPSVLIQLDLIDTTMATVGGATTIATRLIDPNGAVVPLANGTSQIFFRNTYRLRVAALDTAQRNTGIYTYRVELFSSWSGGLSRYDTVSVRVMVNNGRTSPYGAGWDIDGIERIYPFGSTTALLVDGSGGVAYFANSGCGSGACTFVSPPSEFSTLQRNADNTYTRSYRNGTVTTYDASGLMTQTRDRIGNATQFQYASDGSGRLQRIIDPMGKATVFNYADSLGGADKSLRGITDPMGRRSSFLVDASNDLVRITDPDNVVAFQATYSGHQLRTAADRRGGVWTYTIGSDRSLRAVAAPTVIANGVAKNPTVHLTSPTVAIFDSVAAGGGTASRPFPGFDIDSGLATTTATTGLVTTYTVNRFGEAVMMRDPKGAKVLTSYDANGLVTSVQAPNSSTRTTYGAGGLPSSVQEGGVTTTYTFGAFDLPKTVTKDGVATTYWYNAAGSCVDSMQVGANTTKKTRYTCDSRGRVLTVTDPEGHRSWTTYDDPATGNVATYEAQSDTTTRAGRISHTYYDGYGRDTLTVDPSGVGMRHFADLMNRDTLVAGPLGMRVVTHYDSLFVREVVVGGTQHYTFAPNALGWVESVHDTTGTRSYGYDSTGAVIGLRNKRGQLTSYTYDAYGRILSRTLADGRVTRFAYDTGNKWVADSSSEAVDTLRRNTRGSAVSMRSWRGGHRYEIRYGYDADSLLSWVEFNRDSVAFPASGKSYFYYDSAGIKPYTGLVYGLGQAAAASRTSIYHNADGLVTQLGMPSSTGTTLTNSYNSDDRVAQANFNAPYASVLTRNYTWDLLARMTSVANANGSTTRTFDYDSLGRLTTTQDISYTAGTCHPVVNVGMVCSSGSSSVTATSLLSYDVVGNRTDAGAVTDPGNRLRTLNTQSMAYDADGNMTRRANASRTDTLYWASNNQLDSVWTQAGTVSFGYDGLGHRIRKTFNGVTTWYFYDGDKVYAQTDGAGTISRVYHYYPGEDTPAQMALADGSLYHFVQDEAHNVVAVLDNSGTPVAKYNYSPFGTLESGSIDNVPGGNTLRFKARVWDAETDLYENRARYYDAIAGRFISEDPIGLSGGINPYAFGGNDPINHIDPAGTSCQAYWRWSDGTVTLGDVYQDGEGDIFREGPATCCDDRWVTGLITCPDYGGNLHLPPPGIPGNLLPHPTDRTTPRHPDAHVTSNCMIAWPCNNGPLPAGVFGRCLGSTVGTQVKHSLLSLLTLATAAYALDGKVVLQIPTASEAAGALIHSPLIEASAKITVGAEALYLSIECGPELMHAPAAGSR